MNKKWEVYKADEEKLENLVKGKKLSPLLAAILINRSVETTEEVELFLDPTRNDFHDPFLMPDMDNAIDRILKAISNNEKVIIYGDYDVDGITSITVLKKFLAERGLNVGDYTPNRLSEGYGLNKDAVSKIAKQGYNDYGGLWNYRK